MRLTSLFVVLAGLAIGPTMARADFIPIGPPHTGELGHAAILEGIYSPGSAWSAVPRPGGPTVDYSNGVLTALRVDDYGRGGLVDVNSGVAGVMDDRLWIGGPVVATARARFASHKQILGYSTNGQAGDFIELFEAQGSGLNVTGSAELSLPAGQSWSWTRSGSGHVWFSEPAYSPDTLDHLVTYQITGLNDGYNRWMLFWEDLPNLGDGDYNDFVVELSAPVPEPAAVVALALGAGLVARRRPTA